MTVYTAIFGNYDDLKEPKFVTPGWKYVVYTDQPLKSSVWEVVQYPCLDFGPQMTARHLKIIGYSRFEGQSMWVDASFIINCDLNRWMRRMMKGPMTVIRHPERDCVYEEILECIRQRRGKVEDLMNQYLAFKGMNVPAHNGLVSTGILMRESTPGVDKFCSEWWNNMSSTRDQVSFALTAFKYPAIPVPIAWDYRVGREFLHIPHLNNPNRAHRLKTLGIR